MLLWMMLVIGIASSIFEISLVMKFPHLKSLILKNLILGILISMILALLFNFIFALGGIVAFGAFCISSALTSSFYATHKIIENTRNSIGHNTVSGEKSFKDFFKKNRIFTKQA